MFGNKITKIISIEGMHCAHCVKRIEEALKDLKEVKSVKVNLEDKNAEVVLKADVENEILKAAIEDIGFEVTGIQ